jgi:vacuolar-type H+-ATPase catalytic subunit A/Vma1
VLGVGAMRQWRIAALAAGLMASALLVVVGCTSIKDGVPTGNTNDAASYRTWVADSLSQSAAAASERESTRRESETAQAVANACEVLSSTSVDVVTAINAYVNAVATRHEEDAVAKAQAAVDTLNRGADTVATSLNTSLLPQMADAFRAWVDATRAVAKAIGERYGQQEFNAEVDKFNQANKTALDMCGGSH